MENKRSKKKNVYNVTLYNMTHTPHFPPNIDPRYSKYKET